MVRTFERFIARLLISMWLSSSVYSWKRRVMAKDMPHVHAAGMNPDRVLLTGDGIAAGRGVLTHELGLPGFFALSLSEHTGRATDVDIIVDRDMTPRTCLDAVRNVDLFRFDAIVICLGGNEALALARLSEWTATLRSLLDDLERRAPTATQIFLLAVPFFSIDPHFPTRLAAIVDRHVQDLNRVMEELARTRPRMSVVPLPQMHTFEREGPHLYRWWADGISRRISAALDPKRSTADRDGTPEELARQHALDNMHIQWTEPDPVLDRLVTSARRVFGTSIAAITIIDRDRQLMKAVSGMDQIPFPREQAFCDITIGHANALVIEDARSDPQYASHPSVTGEQQIRFYAGYPIEAPDGQRIGAICVTDTEPRQFSTLDIELLHTLARYVQYHLWQKSEATKPRPGLVPHTSGTL